MVKAKSKGKIPINKLASAIAAVATTSDSSASPAKSDSGYEARERKYKAEEALKTLQRAKEYKADKGLMKDVKKLAKDQMNCLKKI